jgi:hypothetical protein
VASIQAAFRTRFIGLTARGTCLPAAAGRHAPRLPQTLIAIAGRAGARPYRSGRYIAFLIDAGLITGQARFIGVSAHRVGASVAVSASHDCIRHGS